MTVFGVVEDNLNVDLCSQPYHLMNIQFSGGGAFAENA